MHCPDGCADPYELTWTQDVARIGKQGGKTDSAGLIVHLAVNCRKLSLMGIKRTVSENDFDRWRRLSCGPGFFDPRGDFQVVLLAKLKVGLNGIHGRNGREQL